MNNFLGRYKKIIEQINIASFFLLLLSLALPWCFTQPLFAIWLITWFLECRWLKKKNIRFGKHTIPILLLCGFVAWEALSLLWTIDREQGILELQKHLPIYAVLLVALFGVNKYYQSHQTKVALILGCLLAIFGYCMIIYWYRVQNTLPISLNQFNFWSMFGNGPIGEIKHRSHLCIILLIAFLFSFDVYQYYSKQYSTKLIGSVISVIDIIFITTIILTGSRTAMLLLPILLIILFLKFYQGRWKKIITCSIVVGIITLFCLGTNYNDRLSSVKNDLLHLHQNGLESISSTKEPRLQIYSCALRHWNEFGFWGVGYGGSEKEMMNLFAKDGLTNCLAKQYGIHNRYLKVWMEMGPIALLFMLFILIGSAFFHTGQVRKNVAYICIVFGWSMLTENVLTMIGALYIFFTLITLVQIEQHEQDLQRLDHP